MCVPMFVFYQKIFCIPIFVFLSTNILCPNIWLWRRMERLHPCEQSFSLSISCDSGNKQMEKYYSFQTDLVVGKYQKVWVMLFWVSVICIKLDQGLKHKTQNTPNFEIVILIQGIELMPNNCKFNRDSLNNQNYLTSAIFKNKYWAIVDEDESVRKTIKEKSLEFSHSKYGINTKKHWTVRILSKEI